MKKYVVFVDYGLEGWKIVDQTDSFDEVINTREEYLSLGNSQVEIFMPCVWTTVQVTVKKVNYEKLRVILNGQDIGLQEVKIEAGRPAPLPPSGKGQSGG